MGGSYRVPLRQTVEHWDIYDLLTFTAAHTARCTARHGVRSHAEPPTMEWAMRTGKKFARQSRAA